MSDSGWRVLGTYPSGLEADLIIAQLESAEIPAIRNSNDSIAIVGPSFQGTTARGFTVLVPASFFEEARELVEPIEDDEA